MRYLMKVYYRTELMDKISGYMQGIICDWRQGDKHLLGCRIFKFETDTPLSDETKAKLIALKEDWMEEITVEEET